MRGLLQSEYVSPSPRPARERDVDDPGHRVVSPPRLMSTSTQKLADYHQQRPHRTSYGRISAHAIGITLNMRSWMYEAPGTASGSGVSH